MTPSPAWGWPSQQCGMTRQRPRQRTHQLTHQRTHQRSHQLPEGAKSPALTAVVSVPDPTLCLPDPHPTGSPP